MPLNSIFTNVTQQLATSGNIGIGTTIAGAVLDVLANSSATALRINQQGLGNLLELSDNGSNRILIDTSGNIGIGTTILKCTLDVTGDINFTANLFQNNEIYNPGPWKNIGSSIYDASGNVGIGTTLPNAQLHVGAGSATVAPIRLTSGTNLTNPVVGAIEFDGNALYSTNNTTSGRGEVPVHYGYVLTSDRTAIGSAIADYFPANSSINLEAGSYYEVDAMCYFTKGSLTTVTWTWAFSSAVSMARSYYVGTPTNGFDTIVTTAPPVTGTAAQLTTSALAHAATASLGGNNAHVFIFKVHIVTNLATNVRLRVTNGSAGTVTPKAGSYYRIQKKRVSAGIFSA